MTTPEKPSRRYNKSSDEGVGFELWIYIAVVVIVTVLAFVFGDATRT